MNGFGGVGVDPKAMIYQIDNGWLISHAPSVAEAQKAARAAAENAAREQKKADLKLMIGGAAIASKVAQSEGEWDQPDIDEEISRLVPHDVGEVRQVAMPMLPGYFRTETRAFPTLKEALTYLATVLE